MQDKLIEFRKSLGKTLQEMADIIGVSKSFYEKIEGLERNPSWNFVNKFKVAFPNTNVDNIFFMNNYTKSVETKESEVN